jgi:hypothetical protein
VKLTNRSGGDRGQLPLFANLRRDDGCDLKRRPSHYPGEAKRRVGAEVAVLDLFWTLYNDIHRAGRRERAGPLSTLKRAGDVRMKNLGDTHRMD